MGTISPLNTKPMVPSRRGQGGKLLKSQITVNAAEKRALPKPYGLHQRNIIRRQQPGERVAGEKRVFAFALVGQGIEADQEVVDEAGVAHDEPAFRQAID